MNKVIDDAGACGRCQAKQAVHEETIDGLWNSFPTFDVWTVPDVPGEVTGFASLERLGSRLESSDE